MVQFSPERVEKIVCIFTIAIFMYAKCSAGSNSCGEKLSTRMDQDIFSKHRLRSRVIESQPINMAFECYVKCMKNCRCLSYNVCNGGKLCELNSEKKDNNISLYEASEECDYHEYQFIKQQPSGCMDPCCSTSEPCLHGARCKASCMKNGLRFQCICAEGRCGDRCENIARNCACFANSPNPAPGLYSIYAPDNTLYRAFCYFDQWSAMTLAMSYSVNNIAAVENKPLTGDYPMSENSHNWDNYRLSLSRMSALRDAAQEWKITCSYQLQGMMDNDYLKVGTGVIDPLVDTGSHCPLVNKIRIRGVGCDMCVVNMIQNSRMWYMRRMDQSSCDHVAGYQNVVPSKGCGYNKPRYFGSYNPGCIDEEFSCTSSAEATTQLWFVHITV